MQSDPSRPIGRRPWVLGALASIAAPLVALQRARAASPSRGESTPWRIGMLVSQTGPVGLYWPSSRHCIEIGRDEVNARGGIAGRPIDLKYIDAGRAPDVVARDALAAFTNGDVDAFVAMHDSAVRNAVMQALKGRVPCIYTPQYEGGDCTRGLYVLGETPYQLLKPVIPWIARTHGVQRWHLVGNDYVWPRGTHAIARPQIAASGGRVVGETYVGFDTTDFSAILDGIDRSGADAVLMTLVGQSSIDFNRQFAERTRRKRVLRMSPLLDEVTLAGIGATNSDFLFSCSGYFAALPTQAARRFAAAYSERYGRSAPLLNALAQSCYEGLLLLEAMGNKANACNVDAFERIAQWQYTTGPRGTTVLHARHTIRDVYLATAEGAAFKVIKMFEAVGSGQACPMSLIQ